jgi:hypothetical protein
LIYIKAAKVSITPKGGNDLFKPNRGGLVASNHPGKTAAEAETNEGMLQQSHTALEMADDVQMTNLP